MFCFSSLSLSLLCTFCSEVVAYTKYCYEADKECDEANRLFFGVTFVYFVVAYCSIIRSFRGMKSRMMREHDELVQNNTKNK